MYLCMYNVNLVVNFRIYIHLNLILFCFHALTKHFGISFSTIPRIQNINFKKNGAAKIYSKALVLDFEQRDKTSICSGGLYLKTGIHVNPMHDKPQRVRDTEVNGGRVKEQES